MLGVRMISGKELAKVALSEELTVRALKQQLHLLHGMPPRFRQRLLLKGQCLDDAAKIDRPMELELVLLSYHVAPALREELLSASSQGSVAEVGFEYIYRLHDREGRGVWVFFRWFRVIYLPSILATLPSSTSELS